MNRRAFLSVFDKTGVVDFAKSLIGLGFEVISTGGTLRELEKNGIAATPVEKITNFPECLGGRVKTMHPAIHAGILAMRGNSEHMEQIEKLDVVPIDVVAINLYPFVATVKKPDCTFELAVENIDIGGPTALRAAAKNWQDVFVASCPCQYDGIIEALKANDKALELKRDLAYKVFELTASYDAEINKYLLSHLPEGQKFPDKLTLTFDKKQEMRYGENPHQAASFYVSAFEKPSSISGAKQLQGKELSYNNINDTNACINMAKDFIDGDETVCVAVKHANPCGLALGKDSYDAYMKAYESDPVSIFGGIISINGIIDEKLANEMVKIFLEIIVAEGYTAEALEVFKSKPNLRLLEMPFATDASNYLEYKSVDGGLLIQDYDADDFEKFEVVTKAKPSDADLEELKFAMKVCKHTKSNAIVLTKDKTTVGVGPGQTNRVTALKIAGNYAGEKAKGTYLGSDAFFPFDDCVDLAYDLGVKAIIQPGGSKRDEDSIKKCDEYGIAMVFTGMRHFKH